MSAPEAAVAAVMEALGCEQARAGKLAWCRGHKAGPLHIWTDRGCPVAVAAADAAVDAARPSIQAEALREFGQHDLHNVTPHCDIANSWYHDGLHEAQQEALYWADRIEAEP